MESKYVIFKIANEQFAIDIVRIKEVSDFESLIKVSDSLDYVEGLINMRGEIVPIINLRKRLNLHSDIDELNDKIIVSSIRDELYGFLVDMTTEIVNIDDEDIHLPSILATDLESDFIEGVAKYNEQLILMLDFEKVID